MKFSKLEHWDTSKGYREILQKTLSTQGRLKLRTQQVISIFLKLKCGNELKKNVAANFAKINFGFFSTGVLRGAQMFDRDLIGQRYVQWRSLKLDQTANLLTLHFFS